MAKLISILASILFVLASLNDELWVKIVFIIFSLIVGILVDMFIKEIKSQNIVESQKDQDTS
jgi:uncharacterized membrane protein YczE